jgi:hypothetical protein
MSTATSVPPPAAGPSAAAAAAQQSASVGAADAVVDLAPLFGFSTRGRRDDWRASAVAARPAELAAALGRLAVGGHTVLTLLDQRMIGALRLLRAAPSGPPSLVALVPNVRGMIREATDHGMIGAGMRRVMRVGPVGLARLAFGHVFDAPAVLRKDFPTLLAILVDLELGEALGLGARQIALHPQMTDLALAMENTAILRDFGRRVAARGARPVLATNNAATLREALIADSSLPRAWIDLRSARGNRIEWAGGDEPPSPLPTGATATTNVAPHLRQSPLRLTLRNIETAPGSC